MTITNKVIHCHLTKSLPNSCFLQIIICQQRQISILHLPYYVDPFVFLFFFFSPLLILLFGFCSFIGGGGGCRGGMFALEICFFVGVTKECTYSICQCKENLASLVTSGLALSGGFSHGAAPVHTRAKSLFGNWGCKDAKCHSSAINSKK